MWVRLTTAARGVDAGRGAELERQRDHLIDAPGAGVDDHRVGRRRHRRGVAAVPSGDLGPQHLRVHRRALAGELGGAARGAEVLARLEVELDRRLGEHHRAAVPPHRHRPAGRGGALQGEQVAAHLGELADGGEQGGVARIADLGAGIDAVDPHLPGLRRRARC